MTLSEPTAGVVVKVVPIGEQGQVMIAIYDAGPERLSRDEAVRVLEAAVARLRDDPTWPLPGQTEAGG
jgi:hypothetical protein